MNTAEALENIRVKAHADASLRAQLLATKEAKNPLRSFCSICTEHGCPISPMDLIMYGEETYASIRRSTNGGGENSPLLDWSDDYYELMMAELSAIE